MKTLLLLLALARPAFSAVVVTKVGPSCNGVTNGYVYTAQSNKCVWAVGGGGGGVDTVGTFSGSAQTNGASISSTTITFGPASATVPGMVSTGTQTMAGAKTFSTSVTSASYAFTGAANPKVETTGVYGALTWGGSAAMKWAASDFGPASGVQFLPYGDNNSDNGGSANRWRQTWFGPGSAASPSLSVADAGVGFYKHASNYVGLAAERFVINGSNGGFYPKIQMVNGTSGTGAGNGFLISYDTDAGTLNMTGAKINLTGSITAQANDYAQSRDFWPLTDGSYYLGKYTIGNTHPYAGAYVNFIGMGYGTETPPTEVNGKIMVKTGTPMILDADKTQITKHLASSGSAPVATVDANAGTGATCTLGHASDMVGDVTLVTGSVATPVAGSQCSIAFNVAYTRAPICVMWPSNSTAATSLVSFANYVTTTTTAMVINAGATPVNGITLKWNYSCVEPAS